ALAAWCYPDAGGYRPLPPLKLACSGLAVAAKKEEWLALAQQAADVLREQTPSLLPDIGKESIWHTQLKAGMAGLYDLFQDAPVLGSLIDPRRMAGDFFRADYAQVADLLRQTLADEDSRSPTVREGDAYELGVAAQGLAEAATLLAGRYHWVVTNVPYLARGKQDEPLRDFCEATFPEAKQDLATVFLERCLEFCGTGGAASTVLPQNWLFLSSYKKLREKLLKGETWQLLARLGPGAFETISGEVVKAVLLSLGKGRAPDGQMLCGLDVSAARAVAEKAAGLIEGEIAQVGQAQQLGNPDARVALEEMPTATLLEMYAVGLAGILNGDSPRFLKLIWEIPDRCTLW
ncbi:MAG: Eco57I restriction-modification methylase domain-containing protein, partial [Caldilinea sp.]